MTALHAIPYLPPAREAVLLDLREILAASARAMVETEERYFGELERPELKAKLEECILRRVPNALQWQVDLFVNHAITAIHGHGPDRALLDLLAATDQIQSPLDLSNVHAILNCFVRFVNA